MIPCEIDLCKSPSKTVSNRVNFKRVSHSKINRDENPYLGLDFPIMGQNMCMSYVMYIAVADDIY